MLVPSFGYPLGPLGGCQSSVCAGKFWSTQLYSQASILAAYVQAKKKNTVLGQCFSNVAGLWTLKGTLKIPVTDTHSGPVPMCSPGQLSWTNSRPASSVPQVTQSAVFMFASHSHGGWREIMLFLCLNYWIYNEEWERQFEVYMFSVSLCYCQCAFVPFWKAVQV